MPDPRTAAVVRKMERADERGAVAALSRAFFEDPNFGYFQPDPLRQMRLLPHFFSSVLIPNRRYGHTYVAQLDARIVGVASWLPPGAHPLAPRDEVVRYVRAAPGFVMVGRRIREAMRLLDTIEKLHIHEPHWYLAALGVDPEFQQRGVGAQLMHGVLARCDRDGTLAYLETQKPENVVWYSRFGFAVRDEVRLEGTGITPQWTMLREPR